jgi:hypothetical protein
MDHLTDCLENCTTEKKRVKESLWRKTEAIRSSFCPKKTWSGGLALQLRLNSSRKLQKSARATFSEAHVVWKMC